MRPIPERETSEPELVITGMSQSIFQLIVPSPLSSRSYPDTGKPFMRIFAVHIKPKS
jgi:hypothetical protein